MGFSISGTALSVCSPRQSVNMIVRLLGRTTRSNILNPQKWCVVQMCYIKNWKYLREINCGFKWLRIGSIYLLFGVFNGA